VDYQLVRHAPTSTSRESAHVAHIPGDQVAKAVVLEDGQSFTLAVVPSTHRIDRFAIADMLHKPMFLAEEDDFAMTFRDCRKGAVPALGEAYGLETIVDDALFDQTAVYFEAGDHEALVRVDAEAFSCLMANALRGVVSRRVATRGAQRARVPLA
jgi:Ala-tRNA(Pro) deacylase